MSTLYYNQKWEQAIANLLDNVDEENFPLEQNKADKGIAYKRTDLEWFQYYAHLYVRYLEIYRQIEDSYDQLVHPQKRVLMKDMLENVIVRMCEVKQNLIRYSTHTNIIQSDYINIDQILLDLKLTPKALTVPLPRYFLDKKTPRDQTIAGIIQDMEISEQTEVIADTVALDTNLQTAIRIIQKLERGRQGIFRGLNFSKIRSKTKDRSPEANNEEDQRTIIIQKYWRAFLARKELTKIREDELKFLGIRKDPISKNILDQAEKQRRRFKLKQKNCEEKFQSQKHNIRAQIKKTEEPSIKQQMLDERRKWIKAFMEMHQFSDVPNKAGDFYKQKDAPVQIVTKDPKEAKKQKKEDPKGKGKKNEIDKFFEDHTAIGPTQAVVKLEETIKTYTDTWGTRDQTEISQEIYDVDLAKDQMKPEVELELQKIVDGIINLQLDGMRIKYGLKKKKEKKSRKKNKKQKKVKIPQGLGKRNPQQLLEQLFEKNIAKVLTPAQIKDFVGEHNTITHLVQKNAELLPDPSFSQIRNIVSEYIGIPLGSETAKNKLEKWSWFLFYGPMGTGKTLMVRALQKETNSIVFDLTPQNVRERYSQKSELIKLIWSVIICAKQYQPSIIIIDDFETIFSGVKSKKKDIATVFGPKMKKIIADMKKNKLWTKTDRIAVIACTNKPYDGSMKEMKKVFDKKIYFPYPNYATRKQLIRQFIEEKTQCSVPNFPYQTFAQISEGFTAGSFKQCVERVLSTLRIQRLKDEPLRLAEFINPLANSICVFAEEYDKLRKFTDQVTGLKERRELKKQPHQEEKKKSTKK